jgi:glycosyltransferase involved in cell wall biosynthesis
MIVVFIINDLSGGGAEKILQLLSEFLAGRSHTVKVITLQAGNDAYALDRRIEKVTLKASRARGKFGRLAVLPVQACELAALFRKWRPDICVANLPRSNVALLMTRWFGNRGPAIITEHAYTRDTYPSSRAGDRVMRLLIRWLYPKADGVLTVSKGVGDGLGEFGIVQERMQVAYNAIELEAIRARAGQAPAALTVCDAPTVITVGRHAEQKDHRTLLRAFALARRRVNARLVLVGQGPLRGELESLARELEISDSVVFAGWQQNPFPLLARSDLFVLSSRFEGFGIVLVEAMACGLPVISTDCRSGPREILRDGEDGVLVPVGDVEALAEAMTRVLSDTELRDRLARKATQRAKDFDISVIGPKYEALLRSHVCRSRAAARTC